MRLHPKSHLDHVHPIVVGWIRREMKDVQVSPGGVHRLTADVPDDLPEVKCGLYGPCMGDPPVREEDVEYIARSGRDWPSRVVRRPRRETRVVTAVAVNLEGETVLATVYGGPEAPREPEDPSLPYERLFESEDFWSKHALAWEGVVA